MAYAALQFLPARVRAKRTAKLFGTASTAQAQISRLGMVHRRLPVCISAPVGGYVPPRKTRPRRFGRFPKWHMATMPIQSPVNAVQVAGNGAAQVLRLGTVPSAAAKTVYSQLIPAKHVMTYAQCHG